MKDAIDPIEIGNRLEKIRLSFSNYNKTEWAERHGFAITQYQHWSKGTRRITVDSAAKLCDLYGLTLDYIYFGRVDCLSKSALDALNDKKR